MALLGARHQPLVGPDQGLAVDVLLEQALAHHQAEVLARAPPGLVGRLVDDVPKVVQPPRLAGLALFDPVVAGHAALPGAGGEAQDLDLHRAALERAGQDVGADRGHHDRTSAHGAGIVQQQGHDRVAEIHVLLFLEGQGRGGIDHHSGQARGVEQAFLEVEGPGAVLLGHQPPLQPVGQARDHAGEGGQLLVEIGAQPLQLLGLAEVGGSDDLVVRVGEHLVGGLRVARVLDVGARGLGRIAEIGGLVGLLAHLHVVDLDHLRVFGIGLLVGQLHAVGRRRFAFALFALLAIAFAAVGLLFAFLAVGGLRLGGVGQVEVAQDGARQPAERRLVVDGGHQLVEAGPGAALDVAPELVDQGLGAVGRRLAGQPFAHQERQHVGHGRAGAVGHPVQTLALDLAFERGGEVGAHAAQRIGADGVGAGLLQGLEDRGAVGRLGPQPRVGRLVVVSQAQGHLVGQAPDAGGLLHRQVARRMRQHRFVPLEAGTFGREHHLQVGQFRERAGRMRQRTLEGFGGGFRLAGHG